MSLSFSIKKIVLAFMLILLLTSLSAAQSSEVLVSGFARSFFDGTAIPKATITILETNQKLKTDANGRFSFYYPIGKTVTLTLEARAFVPTQTGTIVVPPSGLTGKYNEITLQVPSFFGFYLFKTFIGAKEDPNSCHVAATITAYHKTMDDIPQGEADATVVLMPSHGEKPFYFGIFDSGPLRDKTNPFEKDRTQTSLDGGVIFFNLSPSDTPYTLLASKPGVTFTQMQFLCRKGIFINLSPPQSPMALS